MIIRIFIFLSAAAMLSCSTQSGISNSQPESGPTSLLLRFYRGPLNHLSAVRHGQCPMHPSCSEYAVQAVQKHGEIMGWIMACDRLMRCGRDETRTAPQILVNGRRLYDDPVPDLKSDVESNLKQNVKSDHKTSSHPAAFFQSSARE